MNGICFAIASLLVATETDGTSRIPNCAVTAAFTLIRHEGIPTTLSEVEKRFSVAESKTASILEVREVLQTFGVETTAIRVSPNSLRNLDCPIILYFEPGRWRSAGNTGHFVAQICQDADTVTLLDWNQAIPERQLPRSAIEAEWTGIAIVLNRNVPFWTGARVVLPLMVTAAAMWFWTKRRAPVNRTAVFGGLLFIGCVGCGHTAPPPAATPFPMLICPKPLVDLGDVDGATILEAIFDLQVCDTQTVKIKSVNKSCGCTTVGEELIGKQLEPGSKHTFTVNIRPDGNEADGPIVRVISLVTEPPSPGPVTLGVQYQRRARPRISVSELVIETTPGQLATATIYVTHRRGERDPAIPVVAERFSSRDFSVVHLESKTDLVDRGPGPSAGKLAIDRTEIQLVARELHGYGEHPGTMMMGFGDNSQQSIPTRISVPHPFRPLARHVFMGRVQPEKPATAKVRFHRTAPKSVRVREIESTVASAQGRMVADDELEITATAPKSPGRWSGELRVHFDDASVPSVVIPISGIVEP